MGGKPEQREHTWDTAFDSPAVEEIFILDGLSLCEIILICFILIMVLSNCFEVRDFERIATAAPVEKKGKENNCCLIKNSPLAHANFHLAHEMRFKRA